MLWKGDTFQIGHVIDHRVLFLMFLFPCWNNYTLLVFPLLVWKNCFFQKERVASVGQATYSYCDSPGGCHVGALHRVPRVPRVNASAGCNALRVYAIVCILGGLPSRTFLFLPS
jgi:hypothetical protein